MQDGCRRASGIRAVFEHIKTTIMHRIRRAFAERLLQCLFLAPPNPRIISSKIFALLDVALTTTWGVRGQSVYNASTLLAFLPPLSLCPHPSSLVLSSFTTHLSHSANMPGGFVEAAGPKVARPADLSLKQSMPAILVAGFAAFGGLLFGYDT